MHLRSWGPQPLSSIACSPDGTFLAGGSEQGYAYIWATASGELLCSWPAHYRVALKPDPMLGRTKPPHCSTKCMDLGIEALLPGHSPETAEGLSQMMGNEAEEGFAEWSLCVQ